jgi:queuosine precursor transporter
MNERPPRYYDVIAALFVAVLLITQTIAQKIANFGALNVSAGVILFPISYIFGDILTEVYGYARSRRVIWLGFGSSVLMAVVYWLAVWLPPAEGWPNQEAFATVLGFVPRIVAASLVAYWAGEFTNSYILAKMKVFTQGRHLWARTIGSTVIGQAVDTVVVMLVAFAGVLPGRLLLSVGVSIYLVKVSYEVLVTPLTYVIVYHLKRVEGIDVFDEHTDFNPFKLRTDQGTS